MLPAFWRRNLERDIRRMMDAGCDWLHVDIMDAHFVPNLAFAPDTVRRMKEIARVPLDVHLMMDNPEKYVDLFLDAGADCLTVHAEVEGDLLAMLREIRRRGALAGLALKPGTGAWRALGLADAACIALAWTLVVLAYWRVAGGKPDSGNRYDPDDDGGTRIWRTASEPECDPEDREPA